MKKINILLLSILLFIIPSTLATHTSSNYNQECKLAYPMMEVLECESADTISKTLQFFYNETDRYYHTESYTCVSECNADISLTNFDEAVVVDDLVYRILIDGQSIEYKVLSDNFQLFGTDDINAIFQRKFSEGQEFVLRTNADRKSVYRFISSSRKNTHGFSPEMNCV